jgi:hypothetical protein
MTNQVAMQQLMQQVPALSLLWEQMGNPRVITDAKTGRPQVLVDLAFFQSLLQAASLLPSEPTGHIQHEIGSAQQQHPSSQQAPSSLSAARVHATSVSAFDAKKPKQSRREKKTGRKQSSSGQKA